jgi:hypothetical protein
MTEKTALLLFSFSIWGMFSYFFLMSAIDDYKVKVEFQNKVQRGECPFIDQRGNCWTAKEYQDYLESQRAGFRIGL